MFATVRSNCQINNEEHEYELLNIGIQQKIRVCCSEKLGNDAILTETFVLCEALVCSFLFVDRRWTIARRR
jgi:hypothetical protein